MPRSVSSHTSSPQVTRPRSGCTSPAATRSTEVLPGAGRAGEREARAGRDLERDVERERPEPRGGLNAQHRRATPSRSSSLTDSSSAAETATSTAESASAPVKSVEKRS